jgi:uncharacterized protein
MYFEIEGSRVRLGGTMHWVPQGRPLAHWVHDAIGAARLIYLEHDEQESKRGQYAPSGSQPLAQRLPCSWPRIERKYSPGMVSQLALLRPGALASHLQDPVLLSPGVEHLALARSREANPPGPRINYLETAAQSYALSDGVSNADWDEAVSWALDNPASSQKLLESSYNAWIAEDFEEVDRISSRYWLNRFAPIKHAVISARNHLWLPTIRELVQSSDEPTLVLVGEAHLGGADGLLPLLAACGLNLTVASSR